MNAREARGRVMRSSRNKVSVGSIMEKVSDMSDAGFYNIIVSAMTDSIQKQLEAQGYVVEYISKARCWRISWYPSNSDRDTTWMFKLVILVAFLIWVVLAVCSW